MNESLRLFAVESPLKQVAPQAARVRADSQGSAGEAHLRVEELNAFYDRNQVLKSVSLTIQARKITSIIGPSGCGKSTLLRCLNRMHEEARGARAEGKVLLDGEDIYAKNVDPVALRRRVGMVFQKANPFPSMSIQENVSAGIKLTGMRMSKSEFEGMVERALRSAALWDEVKDKLKQPGTALSGGQQQRLCIARALAVNPEAILLDEPCSALDPLATTAIEDLLRSLAPEVTIVIVTHNMQQAARVSSATAFMLMGELVEYGHTEQIFTTPKDRRTEAYITGRFG